MSVTPEVSASAPIMSRRNALLLFGGTALGTAGLVSILDSDPAPQAPAESPTVIVNAPTAEGAVAPASAAPTLDPETRAANNAKTQAETDKLNAEAEKLRTEAEAARTKSEADVTEIRAKTNRDNLTSRIGLGTFVLGVITAAAGSFKWLIDRKDINKKAIVERETTERERIRQDAKAEAERLRAEQEARDLRHREMLDARDAKFNETVTAVLMPEPAERLKAAIELTSFAGVSQYQPRILDATYALLRQRPNTGGKPDPFDLHIAHSFLRVSTALRDAELGRQPAAENAYPDVDAPVPEESMEVWDFESSQVPLIDVSGVVLNGIHTIGHDFTRFDLAGSSFTNSNANNTKWHGADLSDCDFSYANLRGAEFSATQCANMRVADADLRGAVLYHLDFTDFDITAAKFFRGARIIGTKGLPPETMPFLRSQGAIITEGENYFSPDALTSTGDDPQTEHGTTQI